ncbi:hypothetical protein TKK_0010472 [Trichogramma kaykai]
MIKDIGEENCELLYTDTDSLIYQIYNRDIYQYMEENSGKFDTFNFADKNPYGIKRKNNKEIGLMKDEGGGKIMREFVGLRAKAYYCQYDGSDDIKKAKGVNRCVVKKTITGEHYRSCLFDNEIISQKQYTFRSRAHVLTTEKMTKIALNPHDDKRFIIPGTTETLPWGHHSIARWQQQRLAQIQDINRIEEGQQQNQNIKMASNVEGVQQNQDMEMEDGSQSIQQNCSQ